MILDSSKYVELSAKENEVAPLPIVGAVRAGWSEKARLHIEDPRIVAPTLHIVMAML
jgi:hypothetical protein